MIPANELRIGNWIADSGGKFWQIDHWEYWNKVSAKSERIGGGIIPMMTHPYTEHVEQLSHIPITPEWLERFGFIASGKMWSYQTSDQFYIDWSDKDGICLNGIYDDIMSNGDKFEHIKYVHQLQNLFNALTGQELTVKELTPTTT